MYEKADLARIKTILEKIDLIFQIVEESGGVTQALTDTRLRRPAILMHLVAIAEQFDKLKNDGAFDVLSRFDREDLKGAYDMRNFIAHDYEGISLPIVEMVLREKLAKIRECAFKVVNAKT